MADLLVTSADGIGHVTLHRPPVNALTLASYREVTAVFADLSTRTDIRCIVLTGAGDRAFCAGFDFRAFAAAGATEDDPGRPEALHRMFTTIRTCKVPVIGAINGPAIGSGCVLAAVCDIRIAAETARFGLPEIDFGRIGGAAYLGRLVPPGTLRRMALTGQPIPAADALRLGLVDQMVPQRALAATVAALASQLAAKPDAALRQMKAALDRIEGMDLDEAYRTEQAFSAQLRAMKETP